MVFYSGDRIGLLIDEANLHASSRQLGLNIDNKKLLKNYGRHGNLIRANYYTTVIEEQEYFPNRPLVDWLDDIGWTLATSLAKEFTDTPGRRKITGNMDIELAVDALAMKISQTIPSYSPVGFYKI